MAQKSKTGKNGLIEVFRFLCAVWVAYYHGFFPIITDNFRGAVVSVDFFFMVSGLFFLSSMEKYREKPFFKGVSFIIWGRTKKIIAPFLIALASVLVCNVFAELDFNGFNWPLSFLWFFAAQYLFLSLFYLLYKKVKKRLVFNIICGAIILLFMSAVSIDTREIDRFLRSPAMLAMGILLSQIPKLHFDLKSFLSSKKLGIVINSLGFAICAVAFIYLAYLPDFAIWKLHLSCCVICPLLLYFATALPVKGKIFDLLGEFSIYIYLAQCPVLISYYFGNRDTTAQFPLFCICILLMFLLNRVVNRLKKAKAPS